VSATRSLAPPIAALFLLAAPLSAQIEVEVSSYPIGICPAELYAVDLDLDGDRDLVIANHHSHDLRILYGSGDGAFLPGPVIPVPGFYDTHVESIALADFDEDGILDAAVVGHANPEIVLFRGDGAGSFIDPVAFPMGNYSARIDAGDFDGDGNIDVICACRDDDAAAVLLGSGTGLFGPAALVPAGDGAVYVAAADLDADGNLDFVTADAFAGTITRRYGLGNGSFEPPLATAGFPFANSLLVRDLDADGHLDIVVSGFPRTELLRGLGARSYAPAATVYEGTTPRTIIALDLFGAPALDLVVAEAGAALLALLEGDGAGGFALAGYLPVGSQPWGLAAANLDADGIPDLAVANEGANTLSVLLHRGPSAEFRRGDSNGDGALDVADPVTALARLFTPGAAPSPCRDADDANDDGGFDIADPIRVLSTLFSGGAPLPAPACGEDPTADPLGCASGPPCP